MNEPVAAPHACRWVPWAFVGFFVVVVAALTAMAVIAVRGYPGLVTTEAYEKGLAYNRTLEAEAHQEKLGWRGTLSVDGDASGGKRFGLTLRDGQGQAIDGVAHLWLARPTQARMDRDMPMMAQGGGVYEANSVGLEQGVWSAHVSIRRGDDVWQTEKRFVVE